MRSKFKSISVSIRHLCCHICLLRSLRSGFDLALFKETLLGFAQSLQKAVDFRVHSIRASDDDLFATALNAASQFTNLPYRSHKNITHRSVHRQVDSKVLRRKLIESSVFRKSYCNCSQTVDRDLSLLNIPIFLFSLDEPSVSLDCHFPHFTGPATSKTFRGIRACPGRGLTTSDLPQYSKIAHKMLKEIHAGHDIIIAVQTQMATNLFSSRPSSQVMNWVHNDLTRSLISSVLPILVGLPCVDFFPESSAAVFSDVPTTSSSSDFQLPPKLIFGRTISSKFPNTAPLLTDALARLYIAQGISASLHMERAALTLVWRIWPNDVRRSLCKKLECSNASEYNFPSVVYSEFLAVNQILINVDIRRKSIIRLMLHLEFGTALVSLNKLLADSRTIWKMAIAVAAQLQSTVANECNLAVASKEGNSKQPRLNAVYLFGSAITLVLLSLVVIFSTR